MKENHEAFVFISKINEATHKNAINYHKKKNTMTATRSQLTSIKGVGKATMLKLYREFKTVNAMKNATVEELNKVVSKSAAENIYKFFREQDL